MWTVENETQEEYNKRIWNAAIEEAIQTCNAYDRGFSTDAGMIKILTPMLVAKLKIMELKK